MIIFLCAFLGSIDFVFKLSVEISVCFEGLDDGNGFVWEKRTNPVKRKMHTVRNRLMNTCFLIVGKDRY